MKCRIFTAIIFIFFFIIVTVSAQPEVTKQPLVTNTSVLFWAKESPIDWFSGLALGLTGFIGSLVTIFFLIGGAVPGTAGQVNIDYDTELLKQYKEKLKDVWSKEPEAADLEKAKELKSMVNDFGDRLNSERWHQFILAAILYIVIGAFFASFLAHDILQALVIGAGWTGYLGAVGLKSEEQERRSKKNEEIDELFNSLKEKDKELNDLKKKCDIIIKDKDKALEDKDKILTELKTELQSIYTSLS